MLVTAFLGYQARNFELDASAETLVLENDLDLKYARLISSRYGDNEYLFLAFSPKEDLFSDATLEAVTRLRDELSRAEGVTSVFSILDAPLLESPPVSMDELEGNPITLQSESVDKNLARIEFRDSPIYQNLLVSPDLKTTALQINLPVDNLYRELLEKRRQLREKKSAGQLSGAETEEYRKVNHRFQQHRDEMRKKRGKLIDDIRTIMENHRREGSLFLGGVSMIAVDLISFIKNDLKVFGLGVLFFLVMTLAIIFKKPRWIVLPLLCCGCSAVWMIGLLGWFGWEVTVISSNFISLQLIITMAVTIHLIVRYRELHTLNPETDQRRLILEAVRLKLKPCLYAAATTIAGFGSLVLSNILPVITFGWMMIAGIVVSLIVTFLLFPAGLMLLPKSTPPTDPDRRLSLMPIFARFTEKHGSAILIISAVVFCISTVGITRLAVENSFIDYFKDTTEIYRGMKIVDQKLGGTTPLDVIVDFEESGPEKPTAVAEPGVETESDFDSFEEFEEVEDDEKYWFTVDKISRIKAIHDYLDSVPETGKVMSLGALMKVAEKFNDGKALDNFQLALLYTQIPEKFKRLILNQYVSIEHNQVRFSIRVRDSEKTFKRNIFLKKIRRHLINELDLKNDKVRVTGLLVLYNNMLQSLFQSQILTLGITILALLAMFLVLFRSLKIALIAIFPNIFSIAFVLGLMGWMNIPLDMMTITIAAISIGIAVDDTIHYIYRFKQEFSIDRNYIRALHRCHGSIGYAMYYTSVTIIIGFSILALSNFIPSIYFGLLTGLAMLIALVAALTLLPRLLVVVKPLGPEK
jgi:predicted RND superfamily exporter protein